MSQAGQAGQGAVGGALTGAAVGSIVPGVGTAIGAGAGALLGGLGGWFGSQGSGGYEDQLKKLAQYYQNRSAPQAGMASQAENSGFRANQAGLISQLEAMARGQGPSAAALQMREAMDRASGAQASGAVGAGGRGVNAGAAFRNASNNTAAVQAQGARDTMMGRVGEQLGAIGQLSNTIAQGRGADEGTSQFNASQANQTNLANLQAQLQMYGQNDQSQLQALGMGMGAAGPGLGTQLMAGGAMAIGPALQYKQGQQQNAMQQQYMNYLTRGQGGFNQQMGGAMPNMPSLTTNPYQLYAQQQAMQMQQPGGFSQLPSQQPQFPTGYTPQTF